MDAFVLVERLKYLILLILSLTVHEFMHAWTAWRLGDDTAARMGRLTLNPIPHIDPIGTILFPLSGLPLGWAKPVPVQPRLFTRKLSMALGDTLVSVAGPLANLALALVSAVAFGLVLRFAPEAAVQRQPVGELLTGLMLINSGLLIFNLIPIPPLDGSHVLANHIPVAHRPLWDRWAELAPKIFIGLIVVGWLTQNSIIWMVLGPPVRAVFQLLLQISFAIA